MKQNRYERLARRKYPRQLDVKNYIGVELEFISSLEENLVRDILVELQLHNIANLGYDHSIRNEGHTDKTYECRFMFEETKLEEMLIKMQTFVEAVGMRHNDSCGLHVHFDMRNRDKTKCYDKLMAKWPLLKRLTMPNRTENPYCRFPDNPTYQYEYEDEGYDSPEEFFYEDRYTVVNRTNIHTIEIRSHEMTSDMKELGDWIVFILSIINSKQPSRKYITSRIKKVEEARAY